MALSEWDLLVLDHDGKPCDGSFTSPEGVEVEFYKNWLYVRDEKSGGSDSFTRPTVMQIDDGTIRYKDVEIVAVRGPQAGIYAVVWVAHYDRQERGKSVPVTGMAGCAVNGYLRRVWVGVTPESLEFLRHELNVRGEDGDYVRNVPDVFRSLPFDSAERTNQGDAYLASALGFAAPSSQPGQSDEPLFMQMLGKPEKT